MFTPLLASIIDRNAYPVVTDVELDGLASQQDDTILLLAGDAERLAESNDLAVIVPELDKAFRGRLSVLVAHRDAERMLQRRFRFSAFPALVFLRRGEYLGAISRVRDWSDYMREIPQILSRQPSEPPPFKLPGNPARSADNGEGAAAPDVHD